VLSRLVLFFALVPVLFAQDFQPVAVARLEAEAQALYRLELAPGGTDLGAAYTRPGQYIQLRIGERRPRFFAIASSPGAATFELLLKLDDANDPILALKPGDRVDVTAPAGPGFPFEEHASRRWIYIAMGSGISAIRPLLEATAAREPDRRTTLLYGVRNLASLPYRQRIPAWHDHGVDLRLVLSRPDEEDQWTGRTGHVQDHLTKDLVEAREPGQPADVAIFAVGSKEMLAAIREKLVEIGHPEVPIATNF
jgi:NAD(P)H-flavin reductase